MPPNVGLTSLRLNGKNVGVTYQVLVGPDGTFTVSFDSSVYSDCRNLKLDR